MTVADIILLSVIAVCVILAVIYIIKRRKSGKCIGCSGDCSQCGVHKKQ